MLSFSCKFSNDVLTKDCLTFFVRGRTNFSILNFNKCFGTFMVFATFIKH
jgi:hypothetical protein